MDTLAAPRGCKPLLMLLEMKAGDSWPPPSPPSPLSSLFAQCLYLRHQEKAPFHEQRCFVMLCAHGFMRTVPGLPHMVLDICCRHTLLAYTASIYSLVVHPFTAPAIPACLSCSVTKSVHVSAGSIQAGRE